MGIVPNGLRDDRWVFHLVPELFMAQFAKVGAVAQDLVDLRALPDSTVLDGPDYSALDLRSLGR